MLFCYTFRSSTSKVHSLIELKAFPHIQQSFCSYWSLFITCFFLIWNFYLNMLVNIISLDVSVNILQNRENETDRMMFVTSFMCFWIQFYFLSSLDNFRFLQQHIEMQIILFLGNVCRWENWITKFKWEHAMRLRFVVFKILLFLPIKKDT